MRVKVTHTVIYHRLKCGVYVCVCVQVCSIPTISSGLSWTTAATMEYLDHLIIDCTSLYHSPASNNVSHTLHTLSLSLSLSLFRTRSLTHISPLYVL